MIVQAQDQFQPSVCAFQFGGVRAATIVAVAGSPKRFGV